MHVSSASICILNHSCCSRFFLSWHASSALLAPLAPVLFASSSDTTLASKPFACKSANMTCMNLWRVIINELSNVHDCLQNRNMSIVTAFENFFKRRFPPFLSSYGTRYRERNASETRHPWHVSCLATMVMQPSHTWHGWILVISVVAGTVGWIAYGVNLSSCDDSRSSIHIRYWYIRPLRKNTTVSVRKQSRQFHWILKVGASMASSVCNVVMLSCGYVPGTDDFDHCSSWR